MLNCMSNVLLSLSQRTKCSAGTNRLSTPEPVARQILQENSWITRSDVAVISKEEFARHHRDSWIEFSQSQLPKDASLYLLIVPISLICLVCLCFAYTFYRSLYTQNTKFPPYFSTQTVKCAA